MVRTHGDVLVSLLGEAWPVTPASGAPSSGEFPNADGRADVPPVPTHRRQGERSTHDRAPGSPPACPSPGPERAPGEREPVDPTHPGSVGPQPAVPGGARIPADRTALRSRVAWAMVLVTSLWALFWLLVRYTRILGLSSVPSAPLAMKGGQVAPFAVVLLAAGLMVASEVNRVRLALPSSNEAWLAAIRGALVVGMQSILRIGGSLWRRALVGAHARWPREGPPSDCERHESPSGLQASPRPPLVSFQTDAHAACLRSPLDRRVPSAAAAPQRPVV